jgi:putative amide transporter protein
VASVGLLYVGAVLLVNGLMLLQRIPARSAAVLNLFVGLLQCVVPTVVLIQADGDAAVILGASGLYLFGFTYLYVGIVNLAGLEPQGVGWFSLFVALAAVVYAALSFGAGDPVFGVIWLSWALLWSLFFVLLGLGHSDLTVFTGWAVTLLSLPTCAVPAFLMLTGHYRSTAPIAVLWAGALVTLLVAAAALSRRRVGARRTGSQPAYS